VCDGRYDTVSVVREQRVICLLVFQHTTKKPLVCHMGITLNRNVVLKFNSSAFFCFFGVFLNILHTSESSIALRLNLCESGNSEAEGEGDGQLASETMQLQKV